MTRSDIVATIKSSLQEQLIESSTVLDDLEYYFSEWFKAYSAQGMQILASSSAPPPTSEQPEGAV